MEVKENLTKLAYLVAGVVASNEDKIKEAIDEWIEKGHLSESEGKKFVDDMVEKTKQTKKEVEEKMKVFAEEWYNAAHIGTTEQIEALEKRIAALEEKVK